MRERVVGVVGGVLFTVKGIVFLFLMMHMLNELGEQELVPGLTTLLLLFGAMMGAAAIMQGVLGVVFIGVGIAGIIASLRVQKRQKGAAMFFFVSAFLGGLPSIFGIRILFASGVPLVLCVLLGAPTVLYVIAGVMFIRRDKANREKEERRDSLELV